MVAIPQDGPRIHVNGVGSTSRRAERAVLTLNVVSPCLPTAAEAIDGATKTTSAIKDMIAPHCPHDEWTGEVLPGAPISHYSMSTFNTVKSWPYQYPVPMGPPMTLPPPPDQAMSKPWEPVEPITKFTASATFKIKFTDFSVLNTLATQLGGMDNVTIVDTDWRLTDTTRASIESETRRAAAKHAVQKAHDYAQAFLGVAEADLGKRVRVTDINETSHYSEPSRAAQLRCRQRGASRVPMPRNTDEINFQPEDVKFEVSVDAQFLVE